MSIIIDPNPIPIDNDPNPMVGPPGAQIISGVCWPEYFNLQDGQDVNTTQWDFLSPTLVDIEQVRNIMEAMRPQALLRNELIVAYSLWRGTEGEIVVPDQICLFDYCWTPPFAGQTVQSIYSYRLWVLSIDFVMYPQAQHIRPLAPLVILALVAAFAVAVVLIAGIMAMRSGTIKWQEIAGFSRDVLKAPGENIAAPVTALAWPFAAMGIALVAGSIIVPVAMARAQVAIPVGGGRVELGGELGRAGGAPVANAPRRRR